MSARAAAPRVVHMTSAHGPFDIRIFHKECRTLAAAGYDVHVIARGADNAVHDGITFWGWSDSGPEPRLERMTSTVARVYRRARALRARLYHFHDPDLMPVGLLLARDGACVVYDVHEDLAAAVLDKPWISSRLRPPIAWLVRMLEPAAADRLCAVIAATPAIEERFSGCGRCEVVTVNNYPHVREFGRLERSVSTTEAVVCYVGTITTLRGIEVILAAVEQAGAQLLLAGTFDPPSLFDRVRALPGWSRVEYVGMADRAEVADVLRRATIGVHVLQPGANHFRAQPTKLFEYMSAALPVIVSDFPYWRDIVEGSACGICVDPTRPDAVAGAIRWLATHPDEARQMGENGRRAVRTRYSWEAEGEILVGLYRRVLGEPA
jgi:glycosyltransferase involved in cell wall biosynthesis